MAETTPGISPACEACKRKKCKCDRRLPACGQCESSELVCRYTESNKRGIPTGYLGLLEQRLQKTEDALYKTVSELSNSKRLSGSSYSGYYVTHGLVSRDPNVNKYVRMEEWKEYPLEGPDAIEKWQIYMGRNEVPRNGEPEIPFVSNRPYQSPTTVASAIPIAEETSIYDDINNNLPPSLIVTKVHPTGISAPVVNITPTLHVQDHVAPQDHNQHYNEAHTTANEETTILDDFERQENHEEEPQLKQSQRLSSILKHIYY